MAAAVVIRAVGEGHAETAAETAEPMLSVAETAAAAAAESVGMTTAAKEIAVKETAASKTAAIETAVTGKATAVIGSGTAAKRSVRPEMRTAAAAEMMTGMEGTAMAPA